MTPACPHCSLDFENEPDRPKAVSFGRFYRRSDSRWVRRFRCRKCLRTFSLATLHPCYGQNKRQLNEPVRRLLVSNVSQNRIAWILGINRKTVVRKFLFLAAQAEIRLQTSLATHLPSKVIEFDDMETFEHSKCKPVSITLAVESKTRKILGLEVARMPAKGPLASISRRKYGLRPDERREARKALFRRLQPLVCREADIKSDENPHYPRDVGKYFPRGTHKTFKGKRGCVVGQGELKKVVFDPLFSLNHTCAMFRANVARLIRRTWCTTKRVDRLQAHLILYAEFHNSTLI